MVIFFLLVDTFYVARVSNTFDTNSGSVVGSSTFSDFGSGVFSGVGSEAGSRVGSSAFSGAYSGLPFFYWNYFTPKIINSLFFCTKK